MERWDTKRSVEKYKNNFFVGYPHKDRTIEGHPGDLTILLSKHFSSLRAFKITNLVLVFNELGSKVAKLVV